MFVKPLFLAEACLLNCILIYHYCVCPFLLQFITSNAVKKNAEREKSVKML